MPVRLLPAGFLIPLLIMASATTGLAAPAEGSTTVSVTIHGGISLAIKDDGGSYDFGSIPGSTFPDLTRTVTLVVLCNLPSYTITIQATPVLLDGAPTTDILLDNFWFSGPNLTASGPLSQAPSTIVNNGTLTPAGGREHPVNLRLWNLDGNERPGNYGTTVTFTGYTL